MNRVTPEKKRPLQEVEPLEVVPPLQANIQWWQRWKHFFLNCELWSTHKRRVRNQQVGAQLEQRAVIDPQNLSYFKSTLDSLISKGAFPITDLAWDPDWGDPEQKLTPVQFQAFRYYQHLVSNDNQKPPETSKLTPEQKERIEKFAERRTNRLRL
tara:strand:+ start:8886 stop:9350 length:465 start_codon:yes stop_codon:yes gene_type:complete